MDYRRSASWTEIKPNYRCQISLVKTTDNFPTGSLRQNSNFCTCLTWRVVIITWDVKVVYQCCFSIPINHISKVYKSILVQDLFSQNFEFGHENVKLQMYKMLPCHCVTLCKDIEKFKTCIIYICKCKIWKSQKMSTWNIGIKVIPDVLIRRSHDTLILIGVKNYLPIFKLK